MDLELANSTLVESFERYTKDAETLERHADADEVNIVSCSHGLILLN